MPVRYTLLIPLSSAGRTRFYGPKDFVDFRGLTLQVGSYFRHAPSVSGGVGEARRLE